MEELYQVSTCRGLASGQLYMYFLDYQTHRDDCSRNQIQNQEDKLFEPNHQKSFIRRSLAIIYLYLYIATQGE